MNSIRETIQLRRLRRRMPPGSSSGPISGTTLNTNTDTSTSTSTDYPNNALSEPGTRPAAIPRAQLTLPRVPKFPLSSPITDADEVASPDGTEEEDGGEDVYQGRVKEGGRDREREQYKNWDPVVERTRPFDFLTNMASSNTSQGQAQSQSQSQSQTRSRSRNPFANAMGDTAARVGDASERVRAFEESVAHGHAEVQCSARRNPDRPVGLNLDIPQPQPQAQPRKETTGAFVDLNDLKNLSQEREEERTAQKLKGILKKSDAKRNNGDTRGFHKLQDSPDDTSPGERRKRASLLDAISKPRRKPGEYHHGVSPTDRPIMIGFSVPYDSPELEHELGDEQGKEKELDSATTLHTPLTPSIIVTPAKEEGFWSQSHLSPEDSHANHIYARPRPDAGNSTRPRAVSSVYSQPSPHLSLGQDVPPVPALPAFYSSGNDTTQGYASASAKAGIVTENVRKRRSLSASVVYEQDEKNDAEIENEKQIARPRSRSIERPKSRPGDRLTINTALNARASQGWWNYLLSPLLSASSLFSPKTPSKHRPSLPAISTSSEASGLTDEWWEEKQEWEKSEKEKELERSYFSPDTPEATRRVSSWQTMTPNQNPFADFDWSIDEQGQTRNLGQGQGQSPQDQPQNRDAASMMFSGQRIQGAAAEYYQASAYELFSGRPYFECESHVCSITPVDKVVASPSAALDAEEGSRGGLLIDVDDAPRSIQNDLVSPVSGITSINSSPFDDAGGLSRELRGSMHSRAATEAGMASPIPEPETKQPSPELSTNPFEQEQSRGSSPPVPHAPSPAPTPAPANIHIESAAAPAPANIHIEAPPAQPAPNIHYPAPAPAPAPAMLDGPNPFEAPRAMPEPVTPFEVPRTTPDPSAEQARSRPVPAPISMPTPEQTPPPNYGAQVYSPYPRSPESLHETVDRNAIRLSHMPAGPAPAYTPHDNSSYPQPYPNPNHASLPPRNRAAPITRDALTHPTTAQDRIEARRRRHEREDSLAHKAGGFWRGRGPISSTGCFGRSGREGRLRRRWYAAICLFFIGIVVGAILLAVFLTRKGDATPVQSQWLNLTGYPPMPTGISTVAGTEARLQESGCIQPTNMWSCAVPKELQGNGNHGYAADQPSFRLEIRFQNGSYEHSTALASRSLPGPGSWAEDGDENGLGSLSALSLLRRGTNQLFNPSPSPPSLKEQSFLGQYTDNVSKPYDGEETPFYITMLSAQYLSSSSSSSSSVDKRDTDTNTTSSNTTSSFDFPDLDSYIPSPAVSSDGTAAPATLYPLPSSQPVRLYNRGKKDEHYGFYTYFDKSILMSSKAPILKNGKTNSKEDENGGSSKADARVKCTFSQTRFLVQIWTGNATESEKHLLSNANATATSTANNTSTETSTPNPTSTTTSTNSTSSATDFTRPGSFPYPITITLDRHGGNPAEKMVYCYGMDTDGSMHVNRTEVMLHVENRDWKGTIVNKPPGVWGENGTESSGGDGDGKDEDGKEYGGYDGGQGGCGCRWVNWVGAV